MCICLYGYIDSNRYMDNPRFSDIFHSYGKPEQSTGLANTSSFTFQRTTKTSSETRGTNFMLSDLMINSG